MQSAAAAHEVGEPVRAHPFLILAVLEDRAERRVDRTLVEAAPNPIVVNASAQSIVSATPGGL